MCEAIPDKITSQSLLVNLNITDLLHTKFSLEFETEEQILFSLSFSTKQALVVESHGKHGTKVLL